MVAFRVPVYSPRWGGNDTYEINFERNTFSISHNTRTSTLHWVEGRDPVWEHSDTSLFKTLENDSVYAPEVFPDALEYLWVAWRGDSLTDTEAEEQLIALFDWLNQISQSKPKSDFWKSFF